MLLIALMLVVVPIIELYVAVQVAGSIGVLETILLLLAMSLGGAWLVKAEGLGVVRRVRQQVERGELPAAEVVDGLLILTAGVLMLAPGFVTDALGILLLIPFTRRPVRQLVLRRFTSRLGATTLVGARFGSGYTIRRVTDVSSHERTYGRQPPSFPEVRPADPRTD